MEEITRWILLLQVAATLGMVGLIWFVQIVHYPLMSRVGRDQFRRYEMEHQRLTTWVVGPMMLTELVTATLMIWWPPLGIGIFPTAGGLTLLLSIWLVTYTVQVPQHASLVVSYDDAVQKRLVAGNWYRTAAWSARGLLVLWFVASTISAATSDPATQRLAGITSS